MKTFRRTLKIGSIIIVLLLLALLAFVATFDANNYKPQIIEQVESATGRDFNIDGEINLSIFPWVGLKVDDVTLGNEKGFEAAQFASIKQLDIRVNVLPLLKKEVEINRIRLHGLNLSLEVANDKSNNWSSLSQSDASTDEALPESEIAEVSAESESTETGGALQSLNIEGFEFIDAMIRYDDQSADMHLMVTELNLKTSAIQFNKPIDVDFGAHVTTDQPAIDTQLSLSTQLTFNQNFTELSLLDFVFKVYANANTNEMFQQDETFEIKSSVTVLMEDQRIALKRTQITALGTTTSADINVTQFLEVPLVQGTVEVQAFNAREVAKRVGVALPEMAKANALQQVGFRTAIKLHGEKLELNDLHLQLDGSSLSGWLHVLDLAKQQIRYDLVLNQIDLNDYLPPVDKGASSESTEVVLGEESNEQQKTSAADKEIELPVEMMKAIDIQGDLGIASLAVQDYSIKQLLITVNAQNGLITIDPLSMNILDGAITSAMSVDVRKSDPVYKLKLDVDQVTVGPVINPFLKNVMGEKELTMEGAVDLVMDVKTGGHTVNQLKKNSLGKIVLDMKETEVNGFDPEFYMRSSIANYLSSKGLGSSKTIMGSYKPRDVTVFDFIHSTVNLEKGQARTDDFIMDSKRIQIGAKGFADIMNDTMDVNTSVKLARDKTALEKVMDSPLYVRVHGPFDALKYDLDSDRLRKSTSKALKTEAKKQAEDKAKKELKKSTDKFKDRLRDKLKGFF